MEYNIIRERYYYEDGYLYYKNDISPRARKEQRVGSLGQSGYHTVKMNGRHYYLHRVIYCFFNECGYYDIDGWDVDHLNNKPDDNRIENLRLVTHQQNGENRKDTKLNGDYSISYKRKHGIPLTEEQRLEWNAQMKIINQRSRAKKDKECARDEGE